MRRPSYTLLTAVGFDEQLKDAPAPVQAAVREVLTALRTNPLPGQSQLDTRPLEGWLPDSYTLTLAGGRAYLLFRIPARGRLVVLDSLIWW